MRREINSYKPLAYAALFVISSWLFVTILSHWSQFTDILYPSFYKSFYPKFSKLFGWIPFSIGDIIYGLLIIIFIGTIIMWIRCFVLGQKWRGIRVLARSMKFISILYVVFHILWGFNYYKPNLSESLDGKEYTTEELKFIANDSFDKSLALRENITEDKKGVFKFRRKMFYKNLPAKLNLNNTGLQYVDIPKKSLKKFSIYSLFMRYFGVGGYFNPFTGEAQVTRLSPTTHLPISMAHEQAHQMGYATEYEANFIGYLTCIQSGDAALEYSANYKALKYVLSELYPRDSTFVRQKLDSFSPGMKRDYAAEKAFHKKYAGRADLMFSAMNNVYLKANNQKEGIESYNRFVELLVGYYRTELRKE